MEIGHRRGERRAAPVQPAGSRSAPQAIEDMDFLAERFPALATVDLNNSSVYAPLEKLHDARPPKGADVLKAAQPRVKKPSSSASSRGAPAMRRKHSSSAGRLCRWSTVRSFSTPSAISLSRACSERAAPEAAGLAHLWLSALLARQGRRCAVVGAMQAACRTLETHQVGDVAASEVTASEP